MTPQAVDAVRSVQPGAVIFHDPSRIAIVNGAFIVCSPHEYAVLRPLVAAPGALFPRTALQAYLYPPPAVPPHSRVLEVIICRLRRKLSTAGVLGAIETVRSQGYIWRLAA